MSPAEREAHHIARRAEQLASGRAYAAKRFGLPLDEVVGYNSGSCYDKVWVTNRAAAEKVSAQVRGETVNGGWFDGMGLGGITAYDGKFEVMV